MDINSKREILQEYYYQIEYTRKERIICICFFILKSLFFICTLFFLSEHFKTFGLFIFAILLVVYYSLYLEYKHIKKNKYEKTFIYSETINKKEGENNDNK